MIIEIFVNEELLNWCFQY